MPISCTLKDPKLLNQGAQRKIDHEDLGRRTRVEQIMAEGKKRETEKY